MQACGECVPAVEQLCVDSLVQPTNTSTHTFRPTHPTQPCLLPLEQVGDHICECWRFGCLSGAGWPPACCTPHRCGRSVACGYARCLRRAAAPARPRCPELRTPSPRCALLAPELPDTDAALAKMRLNWRTALVLAELELEIEALAQGRQHRKQLKVCGLAAWARRNMTEQPPTVRSTNIGDSLEWSQGRPTARGSGQGHPSSWPQDGSNWQCKLACCAVAPALVWRLISIPATLLPLQELLNKKDMVGDVFNQLRLARQRALSADVGLVSRNGCHPPLHPPAWPPTARPAPCLPFCLPACPPSCLPASLPVCQQAACSLACSCRQHSASGLGRTSSNASTAGVERVLLSRTVIGLPSALARSPARLAAPRWAHCPPWMTSRR